MSVFRENTDQDLEECLNLLCDCIEAVKHSLQKERSFFDARLEKLTSERDEALAEVEELRAALERIKDRLEPLAVAGGGSALDDSYDTALAALAKAKEEMQHLKQQRTP